MMERQSKDRKLEVTREGKGRKKILGRKKERSSIFVGFSFLTCLNNHGIGFS
jgi:hypothetical protein